MRKTAGLEARPRLAWMILEAEDDISSVSRLVSVDVNFCWHTLGYAADPGSDRLVRA